MQLHQNPCQCPKCGWLWMYSNTDKYIPTDVDMNEQESHYVCPKCADEIDVQTLGQKGLDKLRQEYRLLLKGSFQKDTSIEARNDRRSLLEQFFEHIGSPL